MLFAATRLFSIHEGEIEMGNVLSEAKNPKETKSKDELNNGSKNDTLLLSSSGPNTRIKRAKENSGKSPTSSLDGKVSSKRICRYEDNIRTGKSEKTKKAQKIPYLKKFFKLFDDDIIQDFLWNDGCAKITDKYLLSMIYVYFRRAKLTTKEYTRLNFFAALFLAHDMEEDDEELKHEIFPWALGGRWKMNYQCLVARRDNLLKRMQFRCAVSHLTCSEVMDLCPAHPIWQRERPPYHGGASRLYPPEDEEPFNPKGPDGTPVFCDRCKVKTHENMKFLLAQDENTIPAYNTLNESCLPSSKTSATESGFQSREE